MVFRKTDISSSNLYLPVYFWLLPAPPPPPAPLIVISATDHCYSVRYAAVVFLQSIIIHLPFPLASFEPQGFGSWQYGSFRPGPWQRERREEWREGSSWDSNPAKPPTFFLWHHECGQACECRHVAKAVEDLWKSLNSALRALSAYTPSLCLPRDPLSVWEGKFPMTVLPCY